MKNFFVAGKCWVALSIAVLALTSSTTSAQSQPNGLRIGVYDSRAVAVAYYSSGEFREAIKAVKAEYEKARSAKDEKRMKEMEARMKLQQRRQHEQGFSAASVATIMARLGTSLPALAEKAGVQLIVSKWEVNYQSPAVEAVDVTDQIVRLFKLDERALKHIEEVQGQPPLFLEDLSGRTD
jgi:Skp family chaperone for outer membrane proteins